VRSNLWRIKKYEDINISKNLLSLF